MRIPILFLLLCCTVPAVLALSVSPDGGFSDGPVDVTIGWATGNAVTYTLDGTDPANGTPVTGPLTLSAPPATPSTLATSPETAIFPFTPPPATIKARVLRLAERAPNGTIVARATRTFFIGMTPANFTLPVYSVVADPISLENYTIGMLVKGATYYGDLATNGGNPSNPFRPANWNNDSLRWPAHYEIYEDGVRMLADGVVFYPSGRWSGALPKKSFKIKYDKAVGPSKTTYPFFGDESVASYTRIRLRQGSQDWDSGIQMRDCVIGEIAQGLNVEATHCRQVVLFLNGEYWGVYNLHEDFDDKQLAQQYGISKDDIVVIEQDGLVDEGEPQDNQPYFALKSWLATHDLAVQADYEYFATQVNIDSMIDYYLVHTFFNNVDFPNDHRFWRNKNPASQVPGTPYDGRWYFEPKDRDQTMGLYSHVRASDDTIQKLLNTSEDNWGTLFLREAMRNEQFKQRFIARAQELLGDEFSVHEMHAVIDAVAAQKRPEMPREIARWNKPLLVGVWENRVTETKDWLTQRHGYFGNFLLTLNATNVTTNQTGNETNQTGNTSVCYTSVTTLPVTCTGGTITSDTSAGSCRTIVCGAKQVKACDKSDGHFVMYNQVRADQIEVCFGDPAWGGMCMTNWGYMRNPAGFPLCTGAVCGNGVVEDGEQCDGSAPPHYTCTASCTLAYVPYCGDAIVNQPSEECDDGNTIDDDGCTNACLLPPIAMTITLRGSPSIIQLALDMLAGIPGLVVET